MLSGSLARSAMVLGLAGVLMACGQSDSSDADGGGRSRGDGGATGGADARPTSDAPAGTGEPGSGCSCDADCVDDGSNPGACIFGICMTMATGECSEAGSQAECPTGSRCWGLSDFDGGSLCWPDCDAHDCAGSCDGDGSCLPDAESSCDPSCGAACSCTETSCPDGESCVGGQCVIDASGGPGPGPGPTCGDLPARDCTGATCGELGAMSPRSTAAWDDYPINGETTANQYRSFMRRELRMLVGYATSRVACKSSDWASGNGGALGLGDMSEQSGAIPGTSIGSPGHPAGTHTNGFDIDLGYYQTATPDNRLRPICEHVAGGGQDQYHCVGQPELLDVWRHALFLGSIFESSRVRVVGVDGKVGPLLLSAMAQLCEDGWIEDAACGDVALAFEETNMNLGWFQFHHHHTHISLRPAGQFMPLDGCFEPGCASKLKTLPGRIPGLHRLRR